MPRKLTGLLLAGLLAGAYAAAAAPTGTLIAQDYEYYVLGSPEATAAGKGPVCHVTTYRGDPVSIGGVCLSVPAGATDVVVRIQSGGLEATHAHYAFRDAAGADLDTGEICETAVLPVPTDAARLIVTLETLSVSLDCPNPRPAVAGYVGADYYVDAG